MDPKPSIGRIVHYVPVGGVDCMAAIVTRVNDDGRPGLTVFVPPFGAHMQPPEHALYAVEQDEEHAGGLSGTWHWPERA